MLNLLSHNPFVALYAVQAATYAAAAALSWRQNHRSLTICYAASALLHGLLGACHVAHFD